MFFFTLPSDPGAALVNEEAGVLFARLYDDLFPKVYRYISYRVTDRHLAEDLTASVFEKALSKFESYRRERAGLSTWVFTIARNTLIDHYRRTGRQPATEPQPEQMGSDATPPEALAVRNEERMELLSCIERLARREQELVALKFGSGLSNREIALSARLSESNVGVILFRAVRRLRDCIQGHRR